jgi:WD40 repeat protein
VQTGHSDRISSVAFSPSNKVLASGGFDGTGKLWDVSTGRELRTLKGHASYIFSMAFSPDGRSLASGGTDETIKVWDAISGEELWALPGHEVVHSLAFSPSGSSDKTIKLWDVETRQELRTLTGHSNYVFSVAFSPNGETIASGSWDKTVKLWDVNNGQILRTMVGHSDYVWSVALSPDGQTLAAGGGRSETIESTKVRTAAASSPLSVPRRPRQPGGGLTCQAHLPRLISRLLSPLQRPSPGSSSN